MRPPITYFGGKTRLAEWIVGLLPPHDAYIEPFCGSAAILFAKAPSPVEIINDVDGDLVHFFRILRDHPTEFTNACRWTPYAREEFDLAATPTDDPLERARRFWVRSIQAYGGRVSRANGWSVSVVEHTWRPRTVRCRVDEIQAQADRLLNVAIENCDAVELIERLSHRPGTVIYADPPYLFESRSHRAQHKRGGYEHEYGTEQEHRRLAAALHASPATVLISHYPHPLYDELYAGWHRSERLHRNRFNTARGPTARRYTTECVWSNRPIAEQLSLVAAATPPPRPVMRIPDWYTSDNPDIETVDVTNGAL